MIFLYFIHINMSKQFLLFYDCVDVIVILFLIYWEKLMIVSHFRGGGGGWLIVIAYLILIFFKTYVRYLLWLWLICSFCTQRVCIIHYDFYVQLTVYIKVSFQLIVPTPAVFIIDYTFNQ